MSKPHPGGTLELEIDSDLAVPWNEVARFQDDMADLSDDSLLGLVRGGSADAYAVLFERHRHPAHRMAAYYANTHDAKDIVAESFAQVYDLLRRGKGPEESFRAYLFTSVRHEAGRRGKMKKRVTPTDVIETVDRPVVFGNGLMDGFERDLVRAAFAALPKRWQTVLWHVDVEGRKPSEVAPMLGLKPNSVSALAYRAREGLRKSYLEQHVTTTGTSLPAICRDIRGRLVGLVRGSATERDVTEIDLHLDTCDTCMGARHELQKINASLGGSALRLQSARTLRRDVDTVFETVGFSQTTPASCKR
jgi:RNA polymerase sigma factor (sigma-70 family)